MIYILFLVFFIRMVRNTLYQVFLWQIKEYRFDRMMAHLKTWQGKRMVFGPMAIIKWGVIAAYFLDFSIFWPVILIYSAEAVWDFREFWVFGWKRPVWTLKAGFVTAVAISGEILLLLFLISYLSNLSLLSLGILTLDKSLAPGVAFLILILNIPTIIQRSFIINRAKKMIKSRPDLITIGITGSYGKTSTKEFLAQILSSKFKVLKTEGSQNTAIGVAKTIVEHLKDQEIFVCEMGAYKIGEIGQICQICRPKISIISGINEQHLDLFGSLGKTMEAKYELIEALPQPGPAVFNGNNQYTKEMAQKTQKLGFKTILYYCTMTIGQEKADFYADKIKVAREKLDFEVIHENEKQKMGVHLLGEQNVENILAAIAVAQSLGMSLGEISEAVKKLEAPEKTMKLVKLEGLDKLGSLIDDTFNANPNGVLAAIEYMKVYSGKKILILTPMIELGEASRKKHELAGKKAREVCDLVILTNKNYYEDFMRGFGGNEGVKGRVLVGQGKETTEKIKKILDKNGVAVFEGKESARILDAMGFTRPPLAETLRFARGQGGGL